MDASGSLAEDLEELIGRAYSISSDAADDVEEVLRAAREGQTDRDGTESLQYRVVRVMNRGAAGRVRFGSSTPSSVSDAAMGWSDSKPGPSTTTPEPSALGTSPDRPRGLRGSSMSLPVSRAAVAVLVILLMPFAGYLLAHGTGSGSNCASSTTLGSRSSSPNHFVTVAGAPDGASLKASMLPSPSTSDSAQSIIHSRRHSAGQTGSTSGLPPAIIRTDDLAIRVKSKGAERAAGKAEGLAVGFGGYVVSENRGDHNAYATVVIRVPASSFFRVLHRIRGFGRLEYETLNSQDVSLQVVNLGARLKNLQAQRAVLLALFNKATTVADTISVQQVLSGVQSQIDQLAAQMRYVSNQVALATISVTFDTNSSPGPKPVHRNGPIVRALEDAGTAATNVITGAIVLVGYGLPLAAIGLVLYALFLLARRHPRWRRKEA